MRKIIIECVVWYIMLSIVLFLIMSFINLTFDITKWKECYRVIVGIAEAFITLAMLLRYEEQIDKL
jgi:hypothetical protein